MYAVSAQTITQSTIPVISPPEEQSQNPLHPPSFFKSIWLKIQDISDSNTTELKQPSAIDPPASLLDPEYVSLKMCNEPYKFYMELQQSQQSVPSFLAFAKLCNCYKLTATGRIFLEETAINSLKKTHPKDNPLSLVSVGPGGCYQEMIYLAKLANAGYKKIHLTLLEKDSIPLTKLSKFCKTYLKTTKVQIVQFSSLENYATEAMQVKTLQPNLLLLLDLTDEKYNVKGVPLPKYAYRTFRSANILQLNTLIAHSMFERDADNNRIPLAVCSVYDGVSPSLAEIRPASVTTFSVDRSKPTMAQ